MPTKITGTTKLTYFLVLKKHAEKHTLHIPLHYKHLVTKEDEN